MRLKPGDKLETPHPTRIIRIEILDVSETGYGYRYIDGNYIEEKNYLRSEIGTDPFFTSGFWTRVQE